MNGKKRKTADAVEILHHLFIKDDRKRFAALEKERQKLQIAGQIYEWRTRAKLSQAELARMVGTTQSVISRLEDADYEGHSLSMLRRIAKALNCRLELRFVPERSVK
jgi:ribosome-binding protein aMBF1 (putative translation factor)